MSTQERADLVKQALQQQGRLAEAQAQSQKHQEEVPAAQPASVVFRAVMMEYPLRPVMWKAKKSKTCQFRDGQADDDRLSCDGDIGNFEFSLEDQKKGQDLCVTLTSKKEYNSPGVEADWRMFHAFMNALAFAIGANAWPYRIEYWRYGRKLTDRVTSARRLARTRHAPFTDRLAFNAAIGQVEWAFEDTLKKAVSFFESESTLSKEVAQILFLFRQAGDKSVHGGVAIIAFCALLENLVQIVFKERNLDRAKTEDGTAAETFQRAKAEVLAFIEQQMSGNNAGFSRLQGIVQAAGAKNTEQIFKIVVRHLGLRWEEDMKSMFTTWKRNRNGLFHKKERASESEAELKDSMLNQSRIAGAINILVLRLIGYSGPMQSSAFEGAYKRV
jgi:hypothetical protein